MRRYRNRKRNGLISVPSFDIPLRTRDDLIEAGLLSETSGGRAVAKAIADAVERYVRNVLSK